VEKLTHYRNLIKQHLSELADLCNRDPSPGADTLCAFDDERGHYLVLSTGWTNDRRIRGVTLFVRLREGKIWVEEDWTEEGIATQFVRAGVPREDIVLGFYAPEDRKHTEFAVT
jgi:hypothetical protein